MFGTGENAVFNKVFDAALEARAKGDKGRWPGQRGLLSDADPRRRRLRDDASRQQLAFEDALGQSIAEDPPRLVVESLGPPPRPGGSVRMRCQDARYWVGDEAMTPRQLWERAAGALTAVVYGSGLVTLDASADDYRAAKIELAFSPREQRTEGYSVRDQVFDAEVVVGQASVILGHESGRGL